MKPACRLVVVGGGISGLAAAHRLLEKAPRLNQDLRLDLLEAGHRLGGVIHTVREQGFLLEGGPDSFISEKPWAVDLCRRLGLETSLIGTSPRHRRTFIARGGKLLPVPEGFHLIAPYRFGSFAASPLLSWAGKVRMAADLVLPRRRPRSSNYDESLAAFVRRRLGEEALERLAQPLVGGIYTADPEKLGLRATFPQFLEMEERHRSLLLAMWRDRKRQQSPAGDHPAGPRYGLFVSLDQGLQLLVDRLRESIPASSIHLGCRVVSLRRPEQTHRWEIELEKGPPLRADGICLALPAHRSADLLEELDPSLAARLRSVVHASTATVNLAYPAADVPAAMDGFGFLVPAVEKGAMLACSYSHRKL
ncbi:MAG: protoporphyrinogen oxidase, partial [Acidobacteriota bacterium]|nr:protoporphyrinogen oxidase [Acidobacteriota bacterium]